jgi:predicted permease
VVLANNKERAMKQWWNWRKQDKELDKEMQHHLRMAELERVERGASPRDAQVGARREFGNAGLVKELARDAWGWRWPQDLSEDLRYGFRTLRVSLGFSVVAIITLALGIGANTAIFSMVDAALLRAIPVRNPQQLVVLRWKARTEPKHWSNSSYGDCETSFQKTGSFGCSFSLPFFQELQAKDDIFSSATAFAGSQAIDVSGIAAASVIDQAEYVTGDYFETLGIKPLIGRLINHEDNTPSAEPVVVLSYRYWRSQFGGSRELVGKTILLDRIPFAVVGVAEESFDTLSPGNHFTMWIPLSLASRLDVPWDNRDMNASSWWLVIVGRLKPNVALGAATAEVTTMYRNNVAHAHNGQPMLGPDDGVAVDLLPVDAGLTGMRTDASAPLYALMLVVGIILLIACANVAGLALARATSRQKEMAVRFALGASKGRIMRQLLTESLMLSSAGGAIGVLFASWGVAAIQTFLQSAEDGSLPFAANINTRVLLFTVATTILTSILFGFAPAMRGARVDLNTALKEGAGSSSRALRPKRGWLSAGSSLVVAQVALSIVVLAGAGLLVRTLQNLKNVYPGFDTRNILTFRLDPSLIGYKNSDSNNFYRDLQSRLGQIPGVSSVSYSWRPLLGGGLWTTDFHLEGTPKDEKSTADELPIGPGFFRTMRIPLLAGREFNSGDFAIARRLELAKEKRDAEAAAKLKSETGATPVRSADEDALPEPAIVNQALVRKYLPHRNPVGHIFGTQDADPSKEIEKSVGWEIVGVVSDAKYNSLRRDVAPTIYIPNSGGAVSFSMRTAGDPLKVAPQIRAVVSQIDNNLPVSEIRTETQQIERQILVERLVARLSGFFGALALLLACIGLYGLVSYEVARRTREIGIRSALGAARGDVLRLVLAQGMRLTLVGAVLGVGLALLVTRAAQDLLFGVKATDPLTFVGVTLLLFAVTLLACFIPARRAMRVDPVVALRYE